MNRQLPDDCVSAVDFDFGDDDFGDDDFVDDNFVDDDFVDDDFDDCMHGSELITILGIIMHDSH